MREITREEIWESMMIKRVNEDGQRVRVENKSVGQLLRVDDRDVLVQKLKVARSKQIDLDDVSDEDIMLGIIDTVVRNAATGPEEFLTITGKIKAAIEKLEESYIFNIEEIARGK